MDVPFYLALENKVQKPSHLFKSVFNFTFGRYTSHKSVQIYLVIGQHCLSTIFRAQNSLHDAISFPRSQEILSLSRHYLPNLPMLSNAIQTR